MSVLSLLEEEDDALKYYALQQLDRSVHDVWFQMGTFISTVEALYEDEEFPHRQLAALVASKVRITFCYSVANAIKLLKGCMLCYPLFPLRPTGVLLLGRLGRGGNVRLECRSPL